MNDPFWQVPTAKLLTDLESTVDGLTSAAAIALHQKFGPNEAAAATRTPAWLRIGKRFANPLVLILLAASAMSAVSGDIASFIIVTTIVTLSVLLDFWQESRAESAINALRSQVALRAAVRRDGKEVSLPVVDLVPGDIVRLSAGDLVPADGRLLATRDFFVNQALLTGESFPVEKHVTDTDAATDLSAAGNVGLAGTSVISGSATMLVCRTGRDTALGQLADTLITKPPPTSFEIGLRRFSMLIFRIVVVLVLVVMAESMAFHRPWIDSLLFAVALAVGLTPELLPMIMTVTLARGAVLLSRRRVIVKRLQAIHNLGAMDVLCTDKTGTLTEATIALAKSIDARGADSDDVFTLAWLNSHFETGLKSPLDDAILAKSTIDAAPWTKIDEVPFDFERRRVSVLVERDSVRTLIVKGAPEDIIRLSTAVATASGPQTITPAIRAAIAAQFDALSAQGFRLLGIASRITQPDRDKAVLADEAELVLAGFTVFRDPPKASAKAALIALADAGIAVKVLTGDNELVARHLCEELGFDPGKVLTGAQIAAMSDEALIGSLADARLFCRVTPQQKLRIIMTLKRMGQTVGFMGDGINDAPALHAADVGISVDSAADVAKAAAEIILLEQDLGVVHEGVMEGRRTIVNTGKYILMASSANFGNMLSMVLAGFVLPFLPLLPIQLLLNNLIYDLAQTGLPFDRVDDEAIRRPIHWEIKLIERFMMIMGPLSTLFDLATFGVLLLVFQAGEAFFRTGWFVESMATQVLMIFAVRTRRHIFASRPHWAVVALALGATGFSLALPYIPVVGGWFEFIKLPMGFLGYMVLVVGGFLFAIEGAKHLFYRHFSPESSLAADHRQTDADQRTQP